VTVLPSGFQTQVKAIELNGEQLAEAYAPLSITVLLEDNIDISRGDMIVRDGNQPEIGQDIEAMICWMGEKPMQLNGKYAIKQTTRDARCVIKEINYKLDVSTLHRITDAPQIAMNDICRVLLRTTAPILYDSYTRNRETGSFILIDEGTNVTVGAGMIL
jgi:sulfate adenylyltransferase subunit 1